MKHLVNATRQAVGQKNWYAALTMALTLPDICGRLENPNVGSQRRYEAWFDKYMLHRYQGSVGATGTPTTFLHASDCYALRCAYLHQGDFGVEDQRARKALSSFHFTAPLGGCNLMHCNLSDNVLQLQVDVFCEEMCEGVEAWLRDMAGEPEVQKRLGDLGSVSEPVNNGISF